MIRIEQIKWSNFFSYGANNELIIDPNTPLTQIKGYNGSGKTSIPVILGEILYSKNPFGMKKADIVNRNIPNAKGQGYVSFTKNNRKYEVILTRGATITLKLLRDKEDISAHTAVGTYKILETILNMDYKLFYPLTYQSSTQYLTFLTDTDSNRKKFLVNLFNLEHYTKIYELFKSLVKEVDADVQQIKGALSTLEGWLNKNTELKLQKRDLNPIPEVDNSIVAEITEKEGQLKDIKKLNASIEKNIHYKKMLDSIDKSLLIPPVDRPEDTTTEQDLVKDYKGQINYLTAQGSKLKEISDKPVCPTCLQDINAEACESILANYRSTINELTAKIKELLTYINEQQQIKNKLDKHLSIKADFETLSNYIDDTLPEEIIDQNQIAEEIKTAKETLDGVKKEIERLQRENEEILKENILLDITLKQIEEYRHDVAVKLVELDKLNQDRFHYNILLSAFSANGIVALKLEYLVKDLETQINNYLIELSGGRFQFNFILEGDKLSIKINDNGSLIDITALSAGELARVNAATLLAIRKLMMAIADTSINILFLDEITGTLDIDGKEKLISILQKEPMNTFLVSHDWSHPAIPSVTVVRDEETKNSRLIYE